MDYVLQYMKKLQAKDSVRFPWTRETYLSLAYWDKDWSLMPRAYSRRDFDCRTL